MLILDLCTRRPRLLIYLETNVWPDVLLNRFKYFNIRESNSSNSSFITENPEIFYKLYSLTCQWIVHREAPNNFTLFSQEKPILHSSSKVSYGMLAFGLPKRPFFLWKRTADHELSTKMLLKDVKIKQYCKFRFSQQSLSLLSSETLQIAPSILIVLFNHPR